MLCGTKIEITRKKNNNKVWLRDMFFRKIFEKPGHFLLKTNRLFSHTHTHTHTLFYRVDNILYTKIRLYKNYTLCINKKRKI